MPAANGFEPSTLRRLTPPQRQVLIGRCEALTFFSKMLSYSEKSRILRLYRDPNYPLSYSGIEPFRKDLQENYNIKVSTREIKNILSQDNTFQKFRVKKSKDYGSYNPIAPKEAFLLDHLDWIGKPKKHSENFEVQQRRKKYEEANYRSTYLIMDQFSRFVYCLYAKDNTAKEFCRIWQNKFKNKKVCQCIYSDLGTTFKSSYVREFFRKRDIDWRFKRGGKYLGLAGLGKNFQFQAFGKK